MKVGDVDVVIVVVSSVGLAKDDGSNVVHDVLLNYFFDKILVWGKNRIM